MLDINLLRTNPELVKENIRKKFQDEKLVMVDEVVEMDKEYRAAIQQADTLRNQIKVASKQIGMLMGKGQKEEAEKAKKELSSAPSAQLNLPFIAVGKDGPHHLDLTITRPQFEMMTGDLLARTIQPVQNAMRDAGLSASQLGKVLLVGGSTRMPAVERQVKELLGCDPSHSLNPDECVAMGAAVQGLSLIHISEPTRPY